jgi:hypothetical protein
MRENGGVTTNLGVGRSNRSGRASLFNTLAMLLHGVATVLAPASRTMRAPPTVRHGAGPVAENERAAPSRWPRRSSCLLLIPVLTFMIVVVSLRLLLGPLTCGYGPASPWIGLRLACLWHLAGGWFPRGVALWGGLWVAAICLWLLQAIATLRSKLAGARSGSRGRRPEPAPFSGVGQLCPRCSALMVRRVARHGTSPGHEFWGCSRFPDCKGTRPAH